MSPPDFQVVDGRPIRSIRENTQSPGKSKDQCKDFFPMSSMPRVAPKGRDLMTLATLVVKVSIRSNTQCCCKVLESLMCPCGSQDFRVSYTHLRNAFDHLGHQLADLVVGFCPNDFIFCSFIFCTLLALVAVPRPHLNLHLQVIAATQLASHFVAQSFAAPTIGRALQSNIGSCKTNHPTLLMGWIGGTVLVGATAGVSRYPWALENCRWVGTKTNERKTPISTMQREVEWHWWKSNKSFF